jgi:SRSO17 transposase
VERKNGWQLAEAVGDASPDGVQELLNRVPWDADAVRDDLRADLVEHLGDADGVRMLDETGFLNKGLKSVGVQRQYSGPAGRIASCQIGVFLGYASRHGQALIDRALSLPESWASDAARRSEAHVPPDMVFTTQPKQGLAMLERAYAAGVPFAWVTGASVYGADHRLRRGIEAHGRGYGLAVTSGQRFGASRVEAHAAELPPEAWQRLSAGAGMTGPRLYDGAAIGAAGETETGFRRGLLIRRSMAKPDELAVYLTAAPRTTTLAERARVAGTRWSIESLFEAAKSEVGLDESEVRSWIGGHRHITLAMLAHATLTVLRQRAIGGRGSPQPRGPLAADDRAGRASSALASGVAPRARTRCRPALVKLVPTTAAMCQTLPLA